MSDRREGDLLDVEFILHNGHTVVVKELNFKVFDAFRNRGAEYNKRYLWGPETGISIENVSGWRIVSQYN